MLTVASTGLAGGIQPATYSIFVQASLTVANPSYVKLDFAPATGKGTGSATHSVMTAKIPAALAPTESAADCEITVFDASTKLVTCSVGTVNAGSHAIRFISITAPATATAGDGTPYTITGTTTYDNGNGGGGGGVSSAPPPDQPPASATVTVYLGSDKNKVSGDCGTAGALVFTTGANNDDSQATSTTLAGALPGAPCSAGWVGEFTAPAGIASQVSVVDVRGNGTVIVTMDVYGPSISVQFKDLKVFYFPNWPRTSEPGDKLNITNPRCPDGVIPSGKNACLVSLTKDGNVYHHVIALRALGDPGFGDG